ncbi:hypothetical protein CVT24_011605 [Panaeolus cyanescens]|uniref:Cell morphogenesis protein N-terminal domain-containing protein n=1 Tax=Panaeolus cyanescens TaxID=181874 RepID=A0A409YGW6_9AGAR|nr:hypothetical protein CVT24_011605 [Panaeolus cyanescens]
MSEGIQITIPDFDDDDVRSAPNPFGRSGFGFGGGGGFGSGFGSSGLDSPGGTTTPITAFHPPEKSYFSHSRGDSSASIDSTGSATTRYAKTPFSHSAQPSIATTSTAFTKKPSFASIRNAFKSGKSNDPPPVPTLEHTPYPVLKNPFNRSTSSLTYVGGTSSRGVTPTPSSTTGNSFPRPPTPGSTETRFGRTLQTLKGKGHGYSKSQHSQSGSIHHVSDGGSDYGFPYMPSPPPVPRVPSAYGNVYQDEPAQMDFEDDKVVIDPKTPADFALHAVFIRFAAIAEEKIDIFLRQPLGSDSLLTTFMGPDKDPKFDETLNSLGIIGQKHTKKVIGSIMRWGNSQQSETVSSDMIRGHASQSSVQDISDRLRGRKSLASIYIMWRALISVLKLMAKDVLGDALGLTLEQIVFEQFRRPDRKLPMSPNHKINLDLSAALLGHLANIRFTSVTYRFVSELQPIMNSGTTKDLGPKYENLVKGISHIKIKVWPPEAFEEGAEFMESLAKYYKNAHGPTLKIAFAENLTILLHSIGKTAQAETNNPEWARAIEDICPKAREAAQKPRYWNAAFPLAITSLCVAPQTYFLEHWHTIFLAVLKNKDKPRIAIMNALMRLVWTYLYRCQESASTTVTKLEGLMKHIFPPNRTSVYPTDDNLDTLVYITHFILSRHPEYGRELCLELIQESILNKPGTNVATIAPERTAIAVNAVLLSVHNMERECPTPTWPSNHDFFAPPAKEDYPSSSAYLPPTLLKPGMQDFFNRIASSLVSIANSCHKAVGLMTIFEESLSYARVNPAYEETNNFVVRRHADNIVTAYSMQYIPQITLLQTCFQSWPRMLHSSLPIADAIDMLLLGVIHVESAIGETAKASLKRFMDDETNAIHVLTQFNKFLFSPKRICQSSGPKLHIDYSPLLQLWLDIVEQWIQSILRRDVESLSQVDQVLRKYTEIEAASLFLLAHVNSAVYTSAVKIVRSLGRLAAHFTESPSGVVHSDTFHIVEVLQAKRVDDPYLKGFEDLLDKSEQSRLDQWKKFNGEEVALRIADSSSDKDRKIWRYVLPAILGDAAKHSVSASLGLLREGIIVAVARFHPSISYLAGLRKNELPTGLAARNPADRDGQRLVQENKTIIDQWHIWVRILCSTAVLPDSRPALTQIGKDHTRAPSDASFERERYTTTRGLFRYLTPFLDSEYTLFRDAAVLCISSFPTNAYPHLLEDLSLLAGRSIYDDSRPRAGNSAILSERNRRQERLHSAVARIYCITAHLLEQQRASAHQVTLANILKFVRNTQSFLSTGDVRDNHSFHRLRRYFCGIVERLAEGLAVLKNSDRFIPAHMHLTLYRLCEEWCQVGPQSEAVKKRLAAMQRSLEVSSGDSQDALQRFRHETAALSQAAVGALAALCSQAYFSPAPATHSPTERSGPEFTRPLSASALLDRLAAILAASQGPNCGKVKNALQSLLTHPSREASLDLMQEALPRAIVMTERLESSSHRFFEAVAHVICSGTHHFTFAQVACLGLTNLRHPSLEIRHLAFNILEAIHHKHSGLMSMTIFEATVSSQASATYVHAHRLISESLAGEHPQQAISILAQLGNWLPQLPAEAYDTNVILLLLQSLEFWIPNINLMTEDKSAVSREGISCLYHLMYITLRCGRSHAEQILVLWTKLVDAPYQANGHATVRFLLEQAHKVGNNLFVVCASNIVSSLCQTQIGRTVFEELCTIIEPLHMLPSMENRSALPDPQDLKLRNDLSALFPDSPRLSLGSAQFAWLFLSDVAIQRPWEMRDQLPILLHAIFTHLDHRTPFVRERACIMLFQLLRSWIPGYDELPDRRAHTSMKESLASFEKDVQSMYWSEDDDSSVAVPKMKALCAKVVSYLEPLAPNLVGQWGSLALTWGTACSIRATAFRSLQIFRALMPRVKTADLALLLGRLSNTIAAPEENLQSFTSEIFLTLKAVSMAPDLDLSLVPQIFWCVCASLSTTVEEEFLQTVMLLDALLTRLNLDDEATVETLLFHKPKDWEECSYLQPALLNGLRSSITSTATVKVLQTLAQIQDNRLIDETDGRLRDLYTISLPWCLHAMDKPDANVKAFAEDIAHLATLEKRNSIQRIMNSFAKGHFRTRDDFLRQSVSSLREHYGARYWTEVVTLLLGLVLNQERWLRIHAMQVLKVLFMHRETRNPVELLGSELLMPLLRLLETDLAPQALDVLEEPMVMSAGGPAAKHVLRMSMHFGPTPKLSDPDSMPKVFGVPSETGWCIAQADTLRDICRANVMAVFDTCSVPTRPSRIDFEPEVEALASLASVKTPLADDLGGLVKNLHELTNYFNDTPKHSNGIPTRRLEARVAAILAKSSAVESAVDTPQTPFLDVFKVNGIDDAENSDDYSDSDSDDDAFVFDSRTPLRSSPNGMHY